jgi:ADP-ribose pyrophosphatase YjhB (NUDIX family)
VTAALGTGRRAADNAAMKFCPDCGQPVEIRVPEGDHLPRHVCASCASVHYQNPKIVVGCVPEHGGRILLCRRAIEPRLGYWTIPAGFMENEETMQQGAARESWEEAQARVEIGSPLAIVHVLHAQQVHVMFRGRLVEPEFGAGPESLEVRLCEPGAIPWPQLAFPSVRFALEHYLQDRAAGREELHFTAIDRRLMGAAQLGPAGTPVAK